jgi:hypothetical protein
MFSLGYLSRLLLHLLAAASVPVDTLESDYCGGPLESRLTLEMGDEDR